MSALFQEDNLYIIPTDCKYFLYDHTFLYKPKTEYENIGYYHPDPTIKPKIAVPYITFAIPVDVVRLK